MADIFGRIGCASNNSKRLTSALAGAAAAYSGLDTMFVSFGAPRELHWALSGIAVDLTCRGVGPSIDPLVETAISGAAGYAGAMIAQQVLPRVFG